MIHLCDLSVGLGKNTIKIISITARYFTLSSASRSLVVSRSGWGGDQGVPQRWCTGGGEREEVDHEPVLSATCSWRRATCCTRYVRGLIGSLSPVFIFCIIEWAMTVWWNSSNWDVTRCSSPAHSVFTQWTVLKPNFVSQEDHRIASDVKCSFTHFSYCSPVASAWVLYCVQKSGGLSPVCISTVCDSVVFSGLMSFSLLAVSAQVWYSSLFWLTNSLAK